jgi:hypothetical protein
MPVTARLSHRLYETFGEEAGADMVGWMQQIEAQRAELRELNELNFSRVESRIAQFDAAMDARFAQVDSRFAQLETSMDARFAQVNSRFAQLEASIVGRLEAKIEQRVADLMKWSFVFWVGAVTSIAVLARLLR